MRRPLQLSVIFHGIILLALINLHVSPAGPQNVVVIDFSLGNEPLLREGSKTTAVSFPAPLQKNNSKRQQIATIRNQQSEELKPIFPSNSSDTQDIQRMESPTPVMTISTAISDTKVDITDISHFGLQGISHEAGMQTREPSGQRDTGTDDGISSQKTGYIKTHFSYIKDLIHKHLIYPARAKKMGWEGKVITSFIVSSEGYARDVRISKSSGYDILDENAVKAIKNASPFPKPPVEAKIILPIFYQLN